MVAEKAYYPDLIEALRETIGKLQSSGYDDAKLQELKKKLVLILANLDGSESGPTAAE